LKVVPGSMSRLYGAGSLVRLLPLALVALTGCGDLQEAPVALDQGVSRAPLDAFCSATVVGVGVVDVETDYLPNVVACENGNADDEALRAQAVAARSYLYYKLQNYGEVTDGTGDQVYTCSYTSPSARHYEAVASTAGEVLTYNGTLIAGFYVAGAIPSQEDCVALPGDNDPTSTEQWVTYNLGASGAGDYHEQTNLGWVDEGNDANRGCKSQNGADCLAEQGWGYEDILRFYYGADIEHVVATGSCAVPTGLAHTCGIVAEGDATIFDDSSACFFTGCETAPAWSEHEVGWADTSLVTGGYASGDRDCFGRWNLSLAEAGTWAVDVHIPDVAPRVSTVTYRVRHEGVDTEFTVDQSLASGWIELGELDFDVGSFQWVELDDVAPESGDAESGPFVVFDAVRLRDPTVPLDDPGLEPVDDGGTPGADGAGAPEPDAGTIAYDGGLNADAGGFADASGTPADGPLGLPPSVVACGCEAVDATPVTPGWLALLLLAGATSRGRWRRTRSR
jgi:hypothetical protein